MSDRKSDYIMDSAISYYYDDEPQLAYHPQKLFLDNGAFTANRRGLVLEPDRVMDVQESLMPDLTIPLDFPFGIGMAKSEMARRWKKTKSNITLWQSSTKLRKRLVPSLHS